jgi:hypothetical protein
MYGLTSTLVRVARAGKWYSTVAKSAPYMTAAATATSMMFACDAITQVVIERHSIDGRRLLGNCVFGCIYTGAWHRFFYAVLIERMFKLSSATAATAAKVVRQRNGLQLILLTHLNSALAGF